LVVKPVVPNRLTKLTAPLAQPIRGEEAKKSNAVVNGDNNYCLAASDARPDECGGIVYFAPNELDGLASAHEGAAMDENQDRDLLLRLEGFARGRDAEIEAIELILAGDVEGWVILRRR
jgi:hypothetical protein